MSENVRLQNLRHFTVRICRVADDAIVGTGVAVSTGGQVVTCAHVVRAAGVDPREADGAEVGVYFPQARGGEERARRARVAACCPQHDDDVVLLQLVGGAPPLAPEQIAVLGTAEPSEGHGFRSYGYRPLPPYHSGYAYGTILGLVEPPLDRKLLADPVQLRSRHIAAGMSGSAVLDTERNLVVGLIAERWPPGGSPIDDDIGWAVDAYVLTFDPFSFTVQDAPYPKHPAPEPKTDVEAARRAVAPDLGVAWNNAPAPIEEWVGRDDLLAAVSRDWADPERRVTGLIGFGGEGKSSLARRWVDDLLGDLANRPTPDGVFWWGFYTRPSADEFFEAALTYLSGGRIDPRRIPSAGVRAQVVGAMLGAGRHLFVLDGLEVMQGQEGDRYGLLVSADLRDFLSYFAAPGHESFCLVTSRAPVLDLMDYTTYRHRDVTRLSPADGRALLRAVGVTGPNDALDKAVTDWDGHALTLSLLGAYLADRHGGDVAYIGEIPVPTMDESRYERVHRVLRRYDDHLTDAERAFLTLFSAFRTPVEESAFEAVFRAKAEVPSTSTLTSTLSTLDDAAFQAMVGRLVTYRILRYDPRAGHYTAHPLIRAHYLARLTAGDRVQTQNAQERIKDYYLDLAEDTPRFPTLDDLAPLIEAVHHACCAGAYDEAHRIRRERIDQGNRKVIIHQLGAYETALALILDFFPNGESSQDPGVSVPSDKSFILNRVGFCLMSLGRLGEAVPFYERANKIKLNITKDWHNASIGYQNLAELHAHLGALAAGADAAREALALARRAENKQYQMVSLAYQAWVAHLRGDLEAAGAAFQQAEAVQREADPTQHFLYSQRGIHHAEHLRRADDPSRGSGQAAAYARRVTEANLEILQQLRAAFQISQCHRVLGDLDADSEQHESARGHFDQALKIARGITRRDVLIEAQLARGRWAARHMGDPPAAFSDLNEALGYTLDGGYRVYEANVRVGLAWAHRAAGDPARAHQEAERARRMSADMGYHWGQVDAAEALAALDETAAQATEHPE